MNIVVASAHRNSYSAGRQLSRWLDQIQNLRYALLSIDHLRVIAAEGDSTDNTRKMLIQGVRTRRQDLTIVDCSHGGPNYGSTEDPRRMSYLSKVANAIFDSVREDDDILVYVESDLIWKASTILSLIVLLGQSQDQDKDNGKKVDIVAPLVFAGEYFYDVYAYRGLDGQRFGPVAPYHSSLQPKGLTEVSSAGSCLVMRGDVARQVRIKDDGALVGWCKSAREMGYKIYVVSEYRVEHPC